MLNFAVKVMTAPLGKTHLFSVGQAGFIIKSASGQLLGIDLYLSDCVERVEGHKGYKRMLPKILAPSDLEFDVVIATHFHKDHFDDDSIPELIANGHTKLYAAHDCKKDVKRLGLDEANLIYVKPGEHYLCGDFAIDYVDCDHGAGAPLAVGVVITVDGKRIYEAGDTCLRIDRIDSLKKLGTFDAVIGPINGKYGNMNADEFAEFAYTLGDLVIPCHYGMFPNHGGDPGRFYQIMNEQYPNQKFLIMSLGEKYTFE